MQSIDQRINELLEAGRTDDAVQLANQQVQCDPSFENYLVRGILYRLLSELKLSLTDLDRAIELNCNNTWARYQRAEVLISLKRYAQAFDELFYITEKLSSDSSLYPFMCGLLLLHLGYNGENKDRRVRNFFLESIVRNPVRRPRAYLDLATDGSSSALFLAIHSFNQLKIFQTLYPKSQGDEPSSLPVINASLFETTNVKWPFNVKEALAGIEYFIASCESNEAAKPSMLSEVLLRASNICAQFAWRNLKLFPSAAPTSFFPSLRDTLLENAIISTNSGFFVPIPESLPRFTFGVIRYTLSEEKERAIFRGIGNSLPIDSIPKLCNRIEFFLPQLTGERLAFAENCTSLVTTFAALRQGLLILLGRYDKESKYFSIAPYWADQVAIRVLSQLPLYPNKELPTTDHWILSLEAYFAYICASLGDTDHPELSRYSLIGLRRALAIRAATDDRTTVMTLESLFSSCLNELHALTGSDFLVALEGNRSSPQQDEVIEFHLGSVQELHNELGTCSPIKQREETMRASAFINVVPFSVTNAWLPEPVICSYKDLLQTEAILSNNPGHDGPVKAPLVQFLIDNVSEPGNIGVSQEEVNGIQIVTISLELISLVDSLGLAIESCFEQFWGSMRGREISDVSITLSKSQTESSRPQQSPIRSPDETDLGSSQCVREFRRAVARSNDAFDSPSRIGRLALLFILNHEISHALKQHTKVLGLLADEVPFTVPYDGRHALELEADSISGMRLSFRQKHYPWCHKKPNYLSEFDQLECSEIELLFGVLLAFGVAHLHEQRFSLRKSSSTHPSLGVRLKSIRTWFYERSKKGQLYEEFAAAFALACNQISQVYGIPQLNSLAQPIFDELTAGTEFQEVWKQIKATDIALGGVLISLMGLDKRESMETYLKEAGFEDDV